ncbi:MAG: hypothetical protein QOI36_1966 [Pseudonocardiales bacterium]|nr:hypothetical protein [Pseudonocardiales bacterium]
MAGTYRAVEFREYGESDVLRVVEREVPRQVKARFGSSSARRE